MTPRIILLAAALLISSVSTAEEINVQLASDTARFTYLTEAFGQDFGRLELETSFLYNENGDNLINVGMLVRGESVSVPLIISMGARAYYADVGASTVAALAIGGDLLLAPESWGGLGIGGFYFTAPSVVSFLDAEDFTEYGVYINFQISPQASISGGFKHIETSLLNATDIEIEDGAYFGLTLNF